MRKLYHPEELPDATRTSIEKKIAGKVQKRAAKEKSENEISNRQKRAYYLIYDHKYREQQQASKEILTGNITPQQKMLDEIDTIKEQQKDSKQKTFRERLEQAQQNMREENENDLSHEQVRRNKLFDQFMKNNPD